MGKWLNALSEIQQTTDKQVPIVPEGAYGTYGTDALRESLEIGTPACSEEKPLSDMFKDSPIVNVRSHLLCSDILFAADGAEVSALNRQVVYRESELRRLVGCNPKLLRRIHALKVAFDGVVVEAKTPNTR